MSYGRTVGRQLNSAQSKLLTELSQFLRGEVGQAGPQYSGSLAPGASNLQELAFLLGEDFAGGGDGQVDAALARLLGGETGFVEDTGESEAYYSKNVAAPLSREYEDALDAIDQRLGARGLAMSGNRARATSETTSRYLESLERGRSEFAYKDLSARRESRERALDRLRPAIETALGASMSRIGIAADLGGVQRGIAGDIAADEYRKWQESQPLYNPALAMIGGPIQQPVSPYTSADGGGVGNSILAAGAGFFGGRTAGQGYF